MIHFFAETISARERINNRANFFSLLLFSVNILLLNLVYINWPSLRHTEEMALASEPDKQQRSRLLRVTTDNVHENEQQKIDKTTRLSKKDSSGQGALTENYGLNYLSPFHEFQNLMQQSQPASANDNPSAPPGNEKQQSVQDPEQTSRDFQIIANQTGIFRISLPKAIAPKPQPEANAKPTRSKPKQAEIQELYFRKIPEFYQFRSEFALRISNSDQEFSFNTVKYPDYKYFQDMKKEIQRNWYRHAPAGGV